MELVHKIPGEIEYCNMVLPEPIKPEYIQQVQDLKTLPNDVIVATFPRSGTTWMSEILYLITTDGDFDTAKAASYFDRIPYLEFEKDGTSGIAFVNRISNTKNQCARLLKTHLPLRFIDNQVLQQQAKTVVVLRNPKDMLVSLYHFYQGNKTLGLFDGSWSKFFKLVESNHYVYGSWVEHVIEYWKIRQQTNVLVIFYEDMVKDIEGVIYKLATFLGKTLSEDFIAKIKEHTYIESMKKNPTVNGEISGDKAKNNGNLSHVRQGKVGGWKKYFTEEQNKFIEHNYIQKCEAVGLKFQYE